MASELEQRIELEIVHVLFIDIVGYSKLRTNFAAHARSNIESWHFASGLLEPLLDGLRKAGLSIPTANAAPN